MPDPSHQPSDIVDRLLAPGYGALADEAANEILRLRAALTDIAGMQTEYANATVRRMVKRAQETLAA